MTQVAKRKARLGESGGTAKAKASTRVTKSERARKLASAIEGHMRDMGFTEREKNERVSRFVERVDSASARRAKS